MKAGDILKVGDVFSLIAGDNGDEVKMQILRFLNGEATQAEVMLLSGPNRGQVTVLSKELD